MKIKKEDLNIQVSSKVGYYSYLQTNLLKFLKEYSYSITSFVKDNDVLFEFSDKEIKAKISLFFFEQLASQIYTENTYLEEFKKEDWLEHTIFAFNNSKTNIERLNELKNFFKPE